LTIPGSPRGIAEELAGILNSPAMKARDRRRNRQNGTCVSQNWFCRLEIKMVMIAAAWVEVSLAGRALVYAFKILPYGQLRPTASAKHGQLIPFVARPGSGSVTG
jgi:hypothetical protein